MRRTVVLGIIILVGVVSTSLLAAQGGAPAGQGREGRAGGGGGGGGVAGREMSEVFGEVEPVVGPVLRGKATVAG